MDNIIVIKLKALARQLGIKGYYILRNDELIQKLEAHPDVNEQVLIPGLEKTQKHNKISEYQRNAG